VYKSMANYDPVQNLKDDIPEHLRHWPGLFVRSGDQIVEAPPEDQALAQTYPRWSDKGPLIAGRRITCLTPKTTYGLNEGIHVIHVYEVVVPGHLVYVMGPKPVYGEYLDGRLVTLEPPQGEDPFVPANYDGRALPSPAVDYNYDVTIYSFSAPGRHQIDWRIGGLRSNTLEFEVVSSE